MGRVFVGRRTEAEAIDARLASALAGDGGFVLVVGEPGIGKTRLASEIGERASAKGFRVAWGRSWEAEGSPPLWPWIAALRELGVAPPKNGEEAFAFASVLVQLRSAAEAQPLVIVIDDLHAADPASLRLLRVVVRDLRGARIVVLATTRDPALHARADNASLVTELARDADVLELGPLDDRDVRQWIDEVGASEQIDFDELRALAGGHPLFVQELLATTRTTRTTKKRSLGIRAAIAAHLGVLSPAALATCRAAAVLGRELPLHALLAVVDDTAIAARAAVDEAIAASILVSAEPDALRFSHVLVRDELYSQIEPEERASLHRRAAFALANEPALVAEHWLAGGRPEDASTIASAVLAAMRHAISRFGADSAVGLGERARSLHGRSFTPSDDAAIRLAIGDAKMLAGDRDAARALSREVLAGEAARLDGSLYAQGALVFASDHVFGPRDVEAVAFLRESLVRIESLSGAGADALRSRVMARLAAALIPARDETEIAEALRLGEDAIALARASGDESALFTALLQATTAFPEAHSARTRLELTSEAVTLAEKIDEVPRVFPLLGWRMMSCLELGDVDAAEREAANAERLFAAYPHPAHAWRPLLLRTALLALAGRFEEAERIAERARELALEARAMNGVIFWATQRLSFCMMRGEDPGLAAIEAKLEPLAKNPQFGVFRALIDAPLGRFDQVRLALDRSRAIELRAQPGAGVLGWPVVMAGLRDHAQRFYDLVRDDLQKSPLMIGPGGVTLVGPRALLLARLAELLDRHDDARAHYEDALAYARLLRSPPCIAQAERGLAGRAASSKPMPTPSSSSRALIVQREGELWRIEEGAERILLKDTKGLAYLEALVRDPHREIHVLELAGIDERSDGGPLLDAKAKADYRARALALEDEIAEAERFGDAMRVSRHRAELEALAGELARAVGRSGKDRRAASTAERARINVQRRLRDVIRRVEEQNSALGRHLDLSVKTGVFCRYAPTWPVR